MKRRDFFKWLPAIPLSIQALRTVDAPKVEVKPEPQPEPAKPVNPLRRTLGPQENRHMMSACTMEWPVDIKPWE